jgi:hypothetical protein
MRKIWRRQPLASGDIGICIQILVQRMQYSNHKPEPVQKGNPYKLTKNQHIFPVASLNRFRHTETGITAIRLAQNHRIKNLPAEDVLFCARRVWDQRAEKVGTNIEGEFQFLVSRLIKGELGWWHLKHQIITQFYALWEARARYADNPVPAIKFYKITGNKDMTKGLKEKLEAGYANFVDENNSLPSRQATGLHIQLALMSAARQLGGLKWRLCRASVDAGEFLVPDSPSYFYIPLTPKLALLGGSDIDVARPAVMRMINSTALANSRRYAVAHDFSRCFVAPDPNRRIGPPLRPRYTLFPDDLHFGTAAV